MKKILTLTESELIGVVRRITERVNLEDYSQEDFFDVFFQVFREWIFNKLGDESKKYPMSLLLKKYGPEFAEEKGLVHRGARSDFDSSHYSLEHYGKELVRKSHYTLPSSYRDEKFTEKYAKAIPHFVSMMELPPFIDLTFMENEPNRVRVNIGLDYDGWMKYPQRFSVNEHGITDKLKKIFQNFGGVDFGNPAHGEVEMTYNPYRDTGADDWVKKVLNKTIKKAIRELAYGNYLHSIRFKPNSGGGEITMVFKDRAGYEMKRKMVELSRQLLSDMGYGPNLRIDYR
jgi:hypothetical protein